MNDTINGKVLDDEQQLTRDGARSNYLFEDWPQVIQAMPMDLIDKILESPSMFSAGKHPMRDAP